MNSEKMFDAGLYNITVRKGNFDGEVFFEAKVKELPDVVEYADSYEEAYLLAIDSLETTAEALAEQGKVMPSPILENGDFSGRITNCLAFTLGEKFGVTRTIHSIKSSIGSLNQTDFMNVQPKRQQVAKIFPIKPIMEGATEQRCYG
ncbi:antitoxin [Bathymodiolus japonicus methanotrophic gill symbiont]|uniref:type II toxin-antitoxin system HicB family antitoxin n=1 Tax=Bathymodiolus japonicus methanotrophic gill symbiont TaxID=113269 RepID=UPI001B5029C3|nr:hypothetical protein [Bathymodiolus japonicus methanotrophic gill symbiont]GFO72828.1 antitoxin [Bathymodiolus japonicus methanotrophic gill symbiont]